MEEIYDVILDEQLSLLAITETWLKCTTAEIPAEFLPNNYSAFLGPRLGKGGGGAAIVCHRDMSPKPKAVKSLLSGCEFVAITAGPNVHTGTVIVCVYRPPDNDVQLFIAQFQTLCEELLNQHSRIILLGDFNFHMQDLTDKNAMAFQGLLLDLGFFIGRPQVSHVHGNALDLLITKGLEVSDDLCTPLFWTDHFLLQATVPIWANPLSRQETKGGIKPRPKIPMRSTRDFNASVFAHAYFSIKYTQLPPGNPLDISAFAERVDSDLRTTLDLLHPVRWVTSKSPVHAANAWYSDALCDMKRTGRKLERTWLRSGLEQDRLQCQRHNAQYKIAIRNTKREYIQGEIAKAGNNPKALFALCEKFSGHAQSNMHAQKSVLSAQDLANYFDNKVSNICSNLVSPIPVTNISPSHPEGELTSDSPQTPPLSFCKSGTETQLPSTFWSEFSLPSRDKLLQVVNSLKNSTSPLDILPISLFKQIAPFILTDIFHLITLSLSSGTVPPIWKRAAVTPIPKKATADLADPASFRPISQLNIWARITEALVSAHFRSHLECQSCLHDRQVGFRAGRSTEDAILAMRESALTSLEKGFKPATTLLDFSAAFDTVNHATLIQNLMTHGKLAGNVLAWFRSFLSERSKTIKFQGTWSAESPLNTGVPQGSMLSPSLFNIYTVPLAELLESLGLNFVMYADDVQLQVDSSTLESHPDFLSLCLVRIQEWTSQNQLALNASKTELLYRDSKSGPPSWPFTWPTSMDSPVPTLSVRNLGCQVDPEFSSTPQVDMVTKQCHFQLWKLSRFCPLIDFASRKRLLEALVISRLAYCSTSFSGATGILLSRLQAVQNRAIRLVCGLRKFDHLTEARRQVGWLSITKMIHFRLATWTWKILHQACPRFALSWLTKKKSSRPLRACRPFVIPIPRRRSAGGRSLALLAPKVWDTLPPEIQTSSSLSSFKVLTKRFLNDST